MPNKNCTINHSTQDLRLLFVENDAMSRELVILMIKDYFDTIITAEDGLEGLQKFYEGNIDLIITDISMPNMDGVEMIQNIRENNPTIPIIVFSAYHDPLYLINTMKYNINGYINKPVQLYQVKQEIRKVLKFIRLENKLYESTFILKQYQELIDSYIMSSKINSQGDITAVNQKFCTNTGYTKQEILGKSYRTFQKKNGSKKTFIHIWNTIQNEKKNWQGVLKNRTKTGEEYYVRSSIKPILDTEGNIVEYTALQHNVTASLYPQKHLIDTLKHIKNPLMIRFKIDISNIIDNLFEQEIIRDIKEVDEKLLNLIYHYIHPKYYQKTIFRQAHLEYIMVEENSVYLDDVTTFVEEIQRMQTILFDQYSIIVHTNINFVKENPLVATKHTFEDVKQTKEKFSLASKLLKKGNARENFSTL